MSCDHCTIVSVFLGFPIFVSQVLGTHIFIKIKISSRFFCVTFKYVIASYFLAGSLCCSWARNFTLTVPLSTEEYKWVPANCQGNLTKCWGVTCDGLASYPGVANILLVDSCYRNLDKLRQLCEPGS